MTNSFGAVRIILIMITCLGLSACSGAVRWQDAPTSPPTPVHPVQTQPNIGTTTLTDQLNQYYEQWSGVPYIYGGSTREGIDCSAYVQQAVQSVLGVSLPRTTAQQLNHGENIESMQAVTGDLVFFDTGPDVNHVGILLGNNKFMHASQTRGVTISRLDDDYWRSRIIGYRRVAGQRNP